MTVVLTGPEKLLRDTAQMWPRAFFLGAGAFFYCLGSFGAPTPAAKAPAQNPAAQAPQTAARQAPTKSPRKAAGPAHSAKHRGAKSKSGKRRVHERAQRAPTPERISEVQSALAKAGHYSGSPTGKWDASTVEAMKKYQEANGLQPTGKLDAHTLEKLGLGSPISGVAAPRPPASSSSPAAAPTSASPPPPLIS